MSHQLVQNILISMQGADLEGAAGLDYAYPDAAKVLALSPDLRPSLWPQLWAVADARVTAGGRPVQRGDQGEPEVHRRQPARAVLAAGQRRPRGGHSEPHTPVLHDHAWGLCQPRVMQQRMCLHAQLPVMVQAGAVILVLHGNLKIVSVIAQVEALLVLLLLLCCTSVPPPHAAGHAELHAELDAELAGLVQGCRPLTDVTYSIEEVDKQVWAFR